MALHHREVLEPGKGFPWVLLKQRGCYYERNGAANETRVQLWRAAMAREKKMTSFTSMIDLSLFVNGHRSGLQSPSRELVFFARVFTSSTARKAPTHLPICFLSLQRSEAQALQFTCELASASHVPHRESYATIFRRQKSTNNLQWKQCTFFLNTVGTRWGLVGILFKISSNKSLFCLMSTQYAFSRRSISMQENGDEGCYKGVQQIVFIQGSFILVGKYTSNCDLWPLVIRP